MASAANRPITGTDIVIADYKVQDSFSDSLVGLEVNPGLASSFPSLNLQAQRFDYYEFTKLTFVWRPTSAITSTKGMVVVAFDPNPNAREPSTLSEIMAYECSNAQSIYKNVQLNVPAHMLRGRRYVRHGAVKDHLCLFDPGMLVLATQGVAAADDNTELGVLEAHYTIRFSGYHLSGSDTYAPHQMCVLTTAQGFNFTAAGGNVPIDFTTGAGEHLVTNGLVGVDDVSTTDITVPAGAYHISGTLGINANVAAAGYIAVDLHRGSDGATPTLVTKTEGGGLGIAETTASTSWTTINLNGYVECSEGDVLRIVVGPVGAGGDWDVEPEYTQVHITAVN